MANNHDVVYMAPPPAGRLRFDGSPTRQSAMGLVSIVTTVIAFAVVALRILTRKYIVKMPMRVDDSSYFAVAAVIASILLVISNAIQRDVGIGLHIWNVLYNDFTQRLQAWTIVATSFYCLAITFAKLSLLVLYLQLSPVKSFPISVWVLIVFVCGYSLAYILVMVFRCRPVAAAWDMTITGAECYSQVTVMLVLSIANILVDAALFILPLPVIVPLQMRVEKKVSLILLFATGGLVCAAAITRTVIMFAGVMQSADYTWDIIPTYYWCYIEAQLGKATLGVGIPCFNYYVDLSRQTGSPVFTMSLPGQKMHVVTRPELIQTVQKQHRVLAFPPIEAKFASTVCGASREAQDILAKNVNGDEGDFGLSMESCAAMRTALKPGPLLDDMNRAMMGEIAKSLDLLEPARGESRVIGMYSWLRDAITTATTRSVYGPLNPYDDKEVADSFWEFESGLMSILVGSLPSITARKPVAARAKVAKAFEAYYKAGGVQKASALAQMRYQSEADSDLSLEDIARYEVGGSIAILVNTAPSAFWTLLLLHSHPGLLEDIRGEIDACTVTTTQGGSTVKTIDITTLKEACPLLLSAYQEVLRYSSMGTSVREVMEDTYLDRWLLKKGAMLQMPSRIIHQDPSLWGADVAEFNPRRFLPEEKQNRPRDVCFRAFGGGKTLCPGRHFATNEVLAVVAVFIARLDMRPVGGDWKFPTTANTNVAAVIVEPDNDIQVEIKTRHGFEDVKWAIKLEKSEVFAMVTEDGLDGEGS
ncbi:hypothetical protein INS49_014715 [Diaporthe citri]|uniref:uncharacterized protein n=1 Tax=Diaporthe citri TaxID=83186 RepID=UPI001C7FA0D7|nr:uncharacterized protein INS49_014715 [Diaporthe citri]KAG6356841.1 hypothetical protein INS49_014715 [Diaporthe citri]